MAVGGDRGTQMGGPPLRLRQRGLDTQPQRASRPRETQVWVNQGRARLLRFRGASEMQRSADLEHTWSSRRDGTSPDARPLQGPETPSVDS